MPSLSSLQHRRARLGQLTIALADVDLAGAEELVVGHLLQPVGAVAADAGHGEDGCEDVGVEAHLLVDEAAEEVDVGVDAPVA